METMRERFAAVTSDLLAADPRLAVVLADISADLFRPAAARHPDRVINVGIREQLLVSVAGGLSLAGMRPIAHTFASFLVERPFEQIKLDLNHQAAAAGAVLVSAGASYDYSDSGRTHQSPGDVALLGTLPGWTVHVPGHPDEAGRQIAALIDVSRQAADELRTLDPPGALAKPYADYLDARDRGIDFLQEGSDAASQRDASAYLKAKRRAASEERVRRRLARRLGLKACARSTAGARTGDRG